MNLSVHHVAVIVSDYAAAKHFYVDLLGLPVVRENCRGNGLWKLDLRLGDHGAPLLPPDDVLLEIKLPGACPLWLSRLLSAQGIFPTSFSKYGTCYRQKLAKEALRCA